ncbi:MAG: Lrp/AsnC family transcriptional regulator [Pseudomonadota bacterium]
MLDDVDRRILRCLQNDPNAPVSDLAEAARVSSGICTRRLERMRDTGVLQGQRAIIDWAALGYSVEVSLRITLNKTNPRAFDEFAEAARAIPEVMEIQTFLGRVDTRLSVIAKDMGHYQQIYRDAILTLPHITDIEALMHVAEIKQAGALPI